MTVPFNTLTPTRHGLMVANRHDAYVGRSLLAYGEFSQQEVDFLVPYLHPGAVVLDIGANIGALTVPFARLVGPTGRVIAFEPQRLAFQMLCANVALNSLTNVEAHWAAVGDPGDEHTTTIVPQLSPDAPNNFGGLALDAPHRHGEAVPLVQLDELGLQRVTLIKVDVEGMEANVLRGGFGTIGGDRPVLYVEADRAPRLPDLLDTLDRLGYDAWWHTPPLYSPANFRGEAENLFPGIVSVNLLALPRGGTWPAPDGLRCAA